MNHGHHGGGPRTGPTTVHLPQQGHHNNHHNHSHFPNSVVVGQRQINLASTGYRPTYYRHGAHYHGHWHGAGNPAPNGGYGWAHNHHHHHPYRPYFWGLGGWGLGTLVYTSGYSGYYNPYCLTASGPTVVYNYTQPIPVVYNASVASDQNSISPASQILDSAVVVFKQNQYDMALDIINQGVRQHPDDAVLHEFRALVLFAKGDYQQAASTIHSVLAIGPGWDWSTLSGLYADVNIYTAQLRSLEGFVKQNPQDGASRFLLAYHYMSDGYPDAATRQLQQVTALVPNDAVAAAMLKMTSAQAGTVANDPTPIPVPEPPLALPALSQRPAVPEIDATAMVGTWTAVREDGSQFTLTLTGEKTFRWSYQANNQPEQTFDGTYTYEENVLALERNGGGSLVADIKSADGAQFNFKMVGAPNEDPGLNFTK